MADSDTNTHRPDLLAQLRALWARLSAGKRLALVAATGAVVVGMGYVSCSSPADDYAVLYAGMAPEDAGEVIAQLQAAGVKHKLSANGTAVEVPEDKVHELRISMASSGLPRGGGIGFEVFDDQGFGTTSFVEQVNYRRAMQGELARTISAIDVVDSARVHIALGERSLYRETDNPPSASVAVRLRRGRSLDREQVRGVVNLVASSVEGMTAERVVVVDAAGRVLSSGDDDDGNLDDRTELERRLTTRVTDMLERYLGPDHVAVVVTAEMDFRQINRTEEVYDQDKPVVRNESLAEARNGAGKGAGGLAGVQGNLPGAPPGVGGGGGGDVTDSSAQRNYEVNRTVTHTVEPRAKVKKLHVAIMVDHKPSDDPAAASTPRSAEELEQIKQIATEAAGLQATRGDSIVVESMAFKQETPLEVEPSDATTGLPLPLWQLGAIAGGALLLIIIAIVFLLRRRRSKRGGDNAGLEPAEVLKFPVSVADMEAALADPDNPKLDPAVRAALTQAEVFQRVGDAARNDASRAAQVLQSWLRDDDVKEKAA